MEGVDRKFGKLPLSTEFHPPLNKPESIEQFIDGNSYLKEIASLEPRNNKKTTYPLIYDSHCPYLFAFKNDTEFRNNPWLYLFLLPVFAFSVFLLYIFIGQLTSMQHTTQFIIAAAIFLSSPCVGYFSPSFFVRLFQPDHGKGTFHIVVDEKFSRGELINQLQHLLNRKKWFPFNDYLYNYFSHIVYAFLSHHWSPGWFIILKLYYHFRYFLWVYYPYPFNTR